VVINQTAEPRGIASVAVPGALGCAAYGFVLILVGVWALSLGDYPSQATTWTMSAVFGIPAVAVVAALGVLIARINGRWWLKGSLIASWPLYLAAAGILFAAFGPNEPSVNEFAIYAAVFCAGIATPVAAAFLARSWSRPPAATPPQALAVATREIPVGKGLPKPWGYLKGLVQVAVEWVLGPPFFR
jgi:hypothetical protein